MINDLIYIVLAIVFSYLYFKLFNRLKKDYFKPQSQADKLGGIFNFAILFFPKRFFKKKEVLIGYFLYIIDLACLGLSVYLFFKLIGVLQ